MFQLLRDFLFAKWVGVDLANLDAVQGIPREKKHTILRGGEASLGQHTHSWYYAMSTDCSMYVGCKSGVSPHSQHQRRIEVASMIYSPASAVRLNAWICAAPWS